MGHSFHTQTHMHRADLAAQLGYGAPPSWDDEDMFAGAPSACGPSEFWDEARQACVPLALPMPSTTSPVQCPPGQFFDYFRQACVAAAPPPHAAGALADVTIGPHLISPLGWPYAWGQAAGLWGGRDAPAAPDPRRDDRYPGDRGGGTGNPDWATVALVGIGVVGVLGLGYLLGEAMSFYYYPPAPPPRWYDDYPPYYTGAFPPGIRLGDAHLPQAPGWSAGDVFGRSEVDAWGTTLKVALVLGGIAAAYFLYKTVKEVGPPSRKVGEAAGAALVHMGARRAGGRSSTRVLDAEFEPSSSRSPRWLTKYEGE